MYDHDEMPSNQYPIPGVTSPAPDDLSGTAGRSRPLLFIFLISLAITLTACGRPAVITGKSKYPVPAKQTPPGATVPATQRPYVINGKTYYPLPSAEGYQENGIASWYGSQFHGRKTANGEVYNMDADTAAHRTLPMNTYLLVRNQENGREITVRVNDRGPFVKNRIIDLSRRSAKQLGMMQQGTARVRITALGEAQSFQQASGTVNRFLPHQDFSTGDFFVQIGAFTDKNNADRLKDKMLGWGKKTVVIPYNDTEKTFYRVQVRAGTSLVEARHLEKVLDAAGFPGFVIGR